MSLLWFSSTMNTMHQEAEGLRWDVYCILGAQFVSIHRCLFWEPLKLLSWEHTAFDAWVGRDVLCVVLWYWLKCPFVIIEWDWAPGTLEHCCISKKWSNCVLNLFSHYYHLNTSRGHSITIGIIPVPWSNDKLDYLSPSEYGTSCKIHSLSLSLCLSSL